jgi:hypothetical protein
MFGYVDVRDGKMEKKRIAGDHAGEEIQLGSPAACDF